jgi:hypothetical protein
MLICGGRVGNNGIMVWKRAVGSATIDKVKMIFSK